jgi:hypothetical protein
MIFSTNYFSLLDSNRTIVNYWRSIPTLLPVRRASLLVHSWAPSCSRPLSRGSLRPQQDVAQRDCCSPLDTIGRTRRLCWTAPPKIPPSRRLSHKDEAIILAYRWRTRLGLNDAHFRLKRLMPKLSRSMLYRCLKRHRLSRIGSTATCPPLTAAALGGPYTFEITMQEVTLQDADDAIGLLYPVFLAVEQITKDVYAEVATPTPENAAAFLERLIAKSPQKIIAVTTDVNTIFVDWRASFDEEMAVGPHPFAVACRARGLVHWRSRPPSTKPLKIYARGVDIR